MESHQKSFWKFEKIKYKIQNDDIQLRYEKEEAEKECDCESISVIYITHTYLRMI